MPQDNIKRLLEQRNLLKNKKPRFVRKDWRELSKLGKGRKKKQMWRKPKGRHNKLRAKKRSVGKMPGVGYRSPKSVRGTFQGLIPVLITNENQLNNINPSSISVMASVGLKKKIQIATKAKQLGVKFANLDIDKFLDEFQIKDKGKPEKREPQNETKLEKKK